MVLGESSINCCQYFKQYKLEVVQRLTRIKSLVDLCVYLVRFVTRNKL
jgi:hypothetical protein